MEMWLLLVVVFAAGGFGGAVNALMSDNGFLLPRPESVGGATIWRPGFLGNILIGGVSAVISWGLYGPFAARVIVGASEGGPSAPAGLTLSALVGGLLVGVAGARWLTNEVDKTALRTAASQAAAGAADTPLASRLMRSRPFDALKATRGD